MITFKKNLKLFNDIEIRYRCLKDDFNFNFNLFKSSLQRYNIPYIQNDKDVVKIETPNIILTIHLKEKRVDDNIIMKGDQGELIKYNIVSGNIIIGE